MYTQPDFGPSSVKTRAKHAVILRPNDMDDRMVYALLNHSLQKPAVITTNQNYSVAGKVNILYT